VVDGYAGWDEHYRIKVRVIATRPYHALFMKQMLIRGTPQQLNADFSKGIDFTIFNSGEFNADPRTEGVTSETSVNVNFKDRELVILGTQYAGEMKKGVFGVMHYYMPQRGALSMHASANEGPKGDTTLLFGLSGTGKTTLSADPKRALIGDDEHVWTEKGVFNIEGGCYAKCIALSREKEPEIWDAIKFGALLENVKYFGGDMPRTVNYDDISIAENTRVCYPLEHINGSKIPALGGHPKNIIFLTCDANGVLPPVSKLTKEQIMYHFISGYTAKVAGTEMGITEPVPSFSACFGEAFLPLHPFKYASMLAELVEKYHSNVWLMNTGWSGGKYGVGKRMSLKITRGILDAIHAGELDKAEYDTMPGFNLRVPQQIKGIDSKLFLPINTWADKQAYKEQAKKLATQFIKNMEKYRDGTPAEVIQRGGPNSDF
jgi:phosphoenolpyruvate carboxykinase (ATP)